VVCLVSCGVLAGAGPVFNRAKVPPGASVAVWGAGGVGLNTIQAARLIGAGKIIAVDVMRQKLAWAEELGATHVVDASREDPVAAVQRLSGTGGVDFAFEATGVPACVRQAVEMLGYAGTAVAIGVPPIPSDVLLPWGGSGGAAYPHKARLLITDGGDPIPAEDFPQMAGWYLDGRLDLDAMVTRTLGLHDLDEAFRAMLAGEVIRSVVRLDTG